jgi:CSLREA domain-containing protein
MRILSQRMDRLMTAMLRFTCFVLLLTITSRAPESRAQITSHHNSALDDRCPQVERTFIVNATADETDGLPGDGICNTEGGARPLIGLCTLRAALREADDTAGLDEIRFDIPVAAFINEVQAFLRSGRLDAATADSLIAQAQAVTSGI